jgi:hypothetical protein
MSRINNIIRNKHIIVVPQKAKYSNRYLGFSFLSLFIELKSEIEIFIIVTLYPLSLSLFLTMCIITKEIVATGIEQ